jgi:hypothetical protein
MAAEVPQIRAADPEDPEDPEDREDPEDSWNWTIPVAISAL